MQHAFAATGVDSTGVDVVGQADDPVESAMKAFIDAVLAQFPAWRGPKLAKNRILSIKNASSPRGIYITSYYNYSNWRDKQIR